MRLFGVWNKRRFSSRTNFPFSLFLLPFWSSMLSFSTRTDEISHRLSHLLCLQLICLLAGSHQSSPWPGGIPSVRDWVRALRSTPLHDSPGLSLSGCDEQHRLPSSQIQWWGRQTNSYLTRLSEMTLTKLWTPSWRDSTQIGPSYQKSQKHQIGKKKMLIWEELLFSKKFQDSIFW